MNVPLLSRIIHNDYPDLQGLPQHCKDYLTESEHVAVDESLAQIGLERRGRETTKDSPMKWFVLSEAENFLQL